MSMRVATLVSLVSSMEIERREDKKYLHETEHKILAVNSRTTDLLAQMVSDRETIVKFLHITVSNQKEVLAGETAVIF